MFKFKFKCIFSKFKRVITTPILANIVSTTFHDLKIIGNSNFCVKLHTGSMSILRLKTVLWQVHTASLEILKG